ncbi:hypothetical protein R3P38DRAFT_3235878 [Favolaschia claudopus]|uniref:Uncharacterized protein n=1 Tax=Favolaschia claudopus TaxID=2862362 RepID=A0AAV9ZE47_9AGAR
MRRFCFAPLFARLRLNQTDRLRLLQAKCAKDSEFARLIKELDLSRVHSTEEWLTRQGPPYLYGPDILPNLIPSLLSLERLHLPAYQLDPNLLATLNSHPKLSTVVVDDSSLDDLRKLWSQTPLSMSKLEVDSASLDTGFGFHPDPYSDSASQHPDFRSLMSRNLRLVHLVIRGENNIIFGPDTVVIPGLEAVDIDLCAKPVALLSWLPAFVHRHSSLQTIKIFDYQSIWLHDWDKFWPFSLLDASERHTLTSTVKLAAFWISPHKPASPFDDWQVVRVEVEVQEAGGVSALRLLGVLAPQLTSLILRIKLATRVSVRSNDLVSSLCTLKSLKKLELQHMYEQLSHEHLPCALPSRGHSQISGCVDAHAVLRSLSACIAKRATALALIHIVDGRDDFRPDCGYHPWTLNVTYRVGLNREIGPEGLPRFSIPKTFRPPDDIAQSLSMTKENTEYYDVPCMDLVNAVRSQKKKAELTSTLTFDADVKSPSTRLTRPAYIHSHNVFDFRRTPVARTTFPPADAVICASKLLICPLLTVHENDNLTGEDVVRWDHASTTAFILILCLLPPAWSAEVSAPLTPFKRACGCLFSRCVAPPSIGVRRMCAEPVWLIECISSATIELHEWEEESGSGSQNDSNKDARELGRMTT